MDEVKACCESCRNFEVVFTNLDRISCIEKVVQTAQVIGLCEHHNAPLHRKHNSDLVARLLDPKRDAILLENGLRQLPGLSPESLARVQNWDCLDQLGPSPVDRINDHACRGSWLIEQLWHRRVFFGRSSQQLGDAALCWRMSFEEGFVRGTEEEKARLTAASMQPGFPGALLTPICRAWIRQFESLLSSSLTWLDDTFHVRQEHMLKCIVASHQSGNRKVVVVAGELHMRVIDANPTKRSGIELVRMGLTKRGLKTVVLRCKVQPFPHATTFQKADKVATKELAALLMMHHVQWEKRKQPGCVVETGEVVDFALLVDAIFRKTCEYMAVPTVDKKAA